MSGVEVDPKDAGLLSGALLGLFGLWKAWLRIRRDARDDHAGTVNDESLTSIIKHQREQIDAMARDISALRESGAADVKALRESWANDVRALRNDLDVMRGQRDEAFVRAYAAESETARLRARVSALEDRLGVRPG